MPQGFRIRTRLILQSVALACVFALGGCASVPANGCFAGEHDPLEPFNRKVFAFNLALDHVAIKPAAKAYRAALPEFVRDRVRAFIDNLKEPLVFANDLLQGRGGAASISGRRFLVNSTVGVAGLFDRAKDWELPPQSGDFGQTLYAWGVEDGPYLVLPFFGPSNVRDALGLGVDLYASPAGHIGSADVRRKVGIAVGVVDGLDLRARNIETLDELEANSIDFYAYLRSVSRQHRLAVLHEARAGPQEEELIDPDAALPASATDSTPAGTGNSALPNQSETPPCPQ